MQRRAVFRVGALAQLLRIVVFGFVTEDFFYPWTREGVMTRGVEHKNQVGEATHQATREFLLLVEAAFHFAAFRDVHQCAVIAHDLAHGVTHDRRGVQANDRAAVFAVQRQLAPLKHGLRVHFLPQQPALLRIGQKIGERMGEKLFLGIVTQHAHERRIGVQDTIVGSNDVDTFLKGFKKLGKSRFVLA